LPNLGFVATNEPAWVSNALATMDPPARGVGVRLLSRRRRTTRTAARAPTTTHASAPIAMPATIPAESELAVEASTLSGAETIGDCVGAAVVDAFGATHKHGTVNAPSQGPVVGKMI